MNVDLPDSCPHFESPGEDIWCYRCVHDTVRHLVNRIGEMHTNAIQVIAEVQTAEINELQKERERLSDRNDDLEEANSQLLVQQRDLKGEITDLQDLVHKKEVRINSLQEDVRRLDDLNSAYSYELDRKRL
jgi:peptidoglycan hydrolase CwlO-like protein